MAKGEIAHYIILCRRDINASTYGKISTVAKTPYVKFGLRLLNVKAVAIIVKKKKVNPFPHTDSS